MLFNSLAFLIFFPLVTTGYFILPHRYRWLWLLSASCYFYMAFVPIYIVILGFTIVVDYIAGIWIEKSTGKRRKLLLVISLLSNIGVLALFKYWNFLNENLTELLGLLHTKNPLPALHILLPIGLSFHTFQAMSYTIEVYRGHQKAERHFGIYSLYVMFYPQLVAGPIERPQNMLHQFREVHHFDYDRIVSGLRLMLWGMFKKVVIADRLAVYVNHVYDHPADYHGLPVLLATYFFAIQIFCDFSGYSDIALGSARVMGFTLMQNFNLPYFATSVREFWSRWHISLSTWFRDYLYIPLGGNRVKEWRWLLNLLIVFAVSGLWHGARWTFVIWGALHGTYLILEILAGKAGLAVTKKSSALAKAAGWFITFHLVVLGWIFFRATSVHNAWLIIRNIFDWRAAKPFVGLGYGSPLYDRIELFVCLAVILLLFAINAVERRRSLPETLGAIRTVPRWTLYVAFTLMIILLGNYSSTGEFIYFQF